MLQKLAWQKSCNGIRKCLLCKDGDVSSHLWYPSMQSSLHLEPQKGDVNKKEDKEEEEKYKAQEKEGENEEEDEEDEESWSSRPAN